MLLLKTRHTSQNCPAFLGGHIYPAVILLVPVASSSSAAEKKPPADRDDKT